jgi:hypothetical protein
MKTIPLRKSYSGLLILVAVIITIVTIGFMFNLYRIYTARVYSESTEVLNLYAVIANSRLAEIEDLSFEVLANRDIQDNLLMYINAINTYEQYNATKERTESLPKSTPITYFLSVFNTKHLTLEILQCWKTFPKLYLYLSSLLP